MRKLKFIRQHDLSTALWHNRDSGGWTDRKQSLPDFWHMHKGMRQRRMEEGEAHLANRRKQTENRRKQNRRKEMTVILCQEFMIYEGIRHIEFHAILFSAGLGTNFVIFLFWLISIFLKKSHHTWLEVKIRTMTNKKPPMGGQLAVVEMTNHRVHRWIWTLAPALTTFRILRKLYHPPESQFLHVYYGINNSKGFVRNFIRTIWDKIDK